ncbi:cytochrome P450 [Mycobacterium sp. ITM-2016-00318]|uniref:cytochrome P450 n=1 Tax=Mycobacterium sp. ITM-2016-00318 TaxID=2099693 RepID=UPI000CF9A1BF|nr:cytochrome P450 [Mycobacterium sp. ITM-2016-00318]WNG90891.1 cytochrome P450 [Mycobacterium sp. ITM-2016-00318]
MTAADRPAETATIRPPPPPGPRAIAPLRPFVAAACGAGYLVAGEWLIRRLFARYGPMVSIPLPGIPVVLIKDPQLVKQVFTEKPDVLLGGKGVRPSALIYGTGSMFVQEEPEHLRRRKLLTPPLHGKALENYRPIIADSTQEALTSWPADKPFEMLHAARDLALDVIVRVMFGVEDHAERSRLGHPFETLLDLGSSEQLIVRVALHSVGGLKRWPKLDRANRGIDDLLTPMIAARREDPGLENRTDIMSLLLTARGEDGEHLSDKEVRDDLVTLVLAGHETTATTLAWMVDLLLHHPDAMAKVQAEADAAESTTYTQAVINETLRIRPPSPFTGRYTVGDYQLGGYTVPAGTRIVPHIGEVNLDATTYDRPQEFRPERFLDANPPTYAWIPFGGGIKRCLGASFSILELTVVLQTLLSSGRFEAVHDRGDRQVRRGIVLLPHRGVRVRYQS